MWRDTIKFKKVISIRDVKKKFSFTKKALFTR